MNNQGQTNAKELQIQGLIDQYLRADAKKESLDGVANHLDEDFLAAFVGGNLSEHEAKPLISHLVSCSYCRHVSSELVKLDLAFADHPQSVAQTTAQPTKVSEVLGGVLSRIFGTGDGAVFAHSEKDEDQDKEETETKE